MSTEPVLDRGFNEARGAGMGILVYARRVVVLERGNKHVRHLVLPQGPYSLSHERPSMNVPIGKHHAREGRCQERSWKCVKCYSIRVYVS